MVATGSARSGQTPEIFKNLLDISRRTQNLYWLSTTPPQWDRRGEKLGHLECLGIEKEDPTPQAWEHTVTFPQSLGENEPKTKQDAQSFGSFPLHFSGVDALFGVGYLQHGNAFPIAQLGVNAGFGC